MPAKRPANTPFQRALLPYPSKLFTFLAGLFSAFTLFVGFISYKQLHEPPPKIASVEGALIDAQHSKYGLKLKLDGSRASFSLSSIYDPRAVRTLFETRLKLGSWLHLEVDADDLARSKSSDDESPYVEILGLSLEGERVFSPEQVARAQADNAAAGPYVALGSGLLSLLLWVVAWYRSRFQDKADKAPIEATTPDLLALKPPFELHEKFGNQERLQSWLVLLILAGIGVGLLVGGYYTYQGAAHVARVWESGRRARATVTHAIATRNRSPHHTLQLSIEEAGRTFTAESEFETNAAWQVPEQLEVRYLPDAPEDVVTEPAYEARISTLYVAAGMGAGGLAVIVLSLWVTAILRGRLDSVRELARDGVLMHAELVLMQKHIGQASYLEVVHKLPEGEKTRQTFRINDEPLLEQGRVVVLSSRDQRRSHALRSDGYPLKLTLGAARSAQGRAVA